MDRKRRVMLGVLAAGLLAYLGVGWAAARYLTGRARPPFAEPAPDGYESVRLRGADGVRIGGWWRDERATEATVVLLHGNGASRSSQLAQARSLHRSGCAVLAISLRAHGDSEGDRNDLGLSARHDVVAAVELARQRRDAPVVLFGSSLGAAAALFAARSLGDDVAGYVLVGPYADLRVAVRRRTQRYLPPVLDQLAYGALLSGGRLALPEMDRIRPVDAARHVSARARVLVLAGARDERAPVSDANAIAARAPNARVVVVPDLDHEDLGTLPERPAWRHVLAATRRVQPR